MAGGELFVVILAGGSGTRFWPLSREKMPKQLLKITATKSMLGLTLDRALALVPEERICIVTTRSQAGQIKEELGILGHLGVTILREPSGRNTAPAIGLAAMYILEKDPGGFMAVFPADHHIEKERLFLETVLEAKKVALKNQLVTLGIVPSGPETGYGYIQKGEPIGAAYGGEPGGRVFRASRFTEKPKRLQAEKYLARGDFLWNSGIFIWKADVYLEEMKMYLPEHYKGLRDIFSLGEIRSGGTAEGKEIYDGFESISVDYGILEHSEGVAVIPADIGWSDVGSWAALRGILKNDESGNVLHGDVMAFGTSDSLVRSEDRLVVALGLEKMVVVETPDALLVCREEASQDVRKIMERLRNEGREEADLHRLVTKPWGAYKVLEKGESYQVKWLDIEGGKRLSYQSHKHRSEHWTVVAGTATVTLDDEVMEIATGKNAYIPVGARHRIENRGEETLRIIEVQTGDYLGEDDIVRYEDDYGRLG